MAAGQRVPGWRLRCRPLRNQLENYPDTTMPVRRDLRDLILVAEHMVSVWQAKEMNLEWIVQHASLRVTVAERKATRSFTAAVFAVAVVAVMRDIVDSSLTAGIIQWSMFRALVLVLITISVAVVSYLLYLGATRFIR